MTFKQWFSAEELKCQPGLPKTANSVSRRATKESWRKQQRKGIRGIAYEYHFSSLPLETQKELGFLNTSHLPFTSFSIQETPNEYKNSENLISIPEYSPDILLPNASLKRVIALPKYYLNAHDLLESQFAVTKMAGDSMHPSIRKNDAVIIKVLTKKDAIYNGTYLIKVSAGLIIKRLEYSISKEGYFIRNDNNLYNDDFIELETFEHKVEVVGQAVYILMYPLTLLES